MVWVYDRSIAAAERGFQTAIAGLEAASTGLAEMQERKRDGYPSDAYVATVHIGLGEIEEASAALTLAEAQHSFFVSFWRVDPELHAVRADPRFSALMKKVGLAP